MKTLLVLALCMTATGALAADPPKKPPPPTATELQTRLTQAQQQSAQLGVIVAELRQQREEEADTVAALRAQLDEIKVASQQRPQTAGPYAAPKK